MTSPFDGFKQINQLVQKFTKIGWGSERVTQLGQATAKQYQDIAKYLDGVAQIEVPRRYSKTPTEQMCRELLVAAVEDGLVSMVENDRQPHDLSNGDVIAMANRLSAYFMPLESDPSEHIIDCDADPFVPDGWSVEEHQKDGAFQWNAANVALHLDKGQKDGKWIEGNKLRKKLADKPVLNACVIDYLIANPHLIPEEWKGKAVYFWGTIYRNRDGSPRVRCLHWCGDRWRSSFPWLDSYWSHNAPAVVDAR